MQIKIIESELHEISDIFDSVKHKFGFKTKRPKMRSAITKVIKNLRGILSWLAQAGKNLLKHGIPPSMVHIDKSQGG